MPQFFFGDTLPFSLLAPSCLRINHLLPAFHFSQSICAAEKYSVAHFFVVFMLLISFLIRLMQVVAPLFLEFCAVFSRTAMLY